MEQTIFVEFTSLLRKKAAGGGRSLVQARHAAVCAPPPWHDSNHDAELAGVFKALVHEADGGRRLLRAPSLASLIQARTRKLQAPLPAELVFHSLIKCIVRRVSLQAAACGASAANYASSSS